MACSSSSPSSALAENVAAPARLRAQHVGIGAVVGQQDRQAIGHAAQMGLVRLRIGESADAAIAALLRARAAQRDELAEIAEPFAVAAPAAPGVAAARCRRALPSA
jgi:hypothetical protein